MFALQIPIGDPRMKLSHAVFVNENGMTGYSKFIRLLHPNKLQSVRHKENMDENFKRFYIGHELRSRWWLGAAHLQVRHHAVNQVGRPFFTGSLQSLFFRNTEPSCKYRHPVVGRPKKSSGWRPTVGAEV